jgi:hypothetical protein
MNQYRHGQAREDGLVFLQNKFKKLDEKKYFLFEVWVTPETFESYKTGFKKSRLKRKEKHKKWFKKYYCENKLKIRKERLSYWKKYHSNPIVKQRNNERRKFLLRNNPQYAIANRLRKMLRDVIKFKKYSKSKNIEKIIGCSASFLRRHFENQFRDGMCWENPKSFHIDHIRPLSHFDLTNPENIKISCNWRNLQPLLPIENMMKGKNLTLD